MNKENAKSEAEIRAKIQKEISELPLNTKELYCIDLSEGYAYKEREYDKIISKLKLNSETASNVGMASVLIFGSAGMVGGLMGLDPAIAGGTICAGVAFGLCSLLGVGGYYYHERNKVCAQKWACINERNIAQDEAWKSYSSELNSESGDSAQELEQSR